MENEIKLKKVYQVQVKTKWTCPADWTSKDGWKSFPVPNQPGWKHDLLSSEEDANAQYEYVKNHYLNHSIELESLEGIRIVSWYISDPEIKEMDLPEKK